MIEITLAAEQGHAQRECRIDVDPDKAVSTGWIACGDYRLAFAPAQYWKKIVRIAADQGFSILKGESELTEFVGLVAFLPQAIHLLSQ